ncbi:hypothetical protein [Cognatiyoonia sp. IB215182]|uniref:hypothetical protein n=1 Tax=Cognatiyoonia sp. IB215182 TaxID=3097353 RepID=UPI002A0DE96F|nr:hypothetical protein [Cognatiyoonia sp. IB215182]MDX8352495.1 hypothetical protein [Cognatiyoonia sp. IB215182]
MTLVITMTIAALILGALLPLRFGAVGFVAATAFLFLAQLAVNTAGGFARASIEESLLLFNGSYIAYVGFNMQITYRAFAVPVFALALVVIIRLFRRDRVTGAQD